MLKLFTLTLLLLNSGHSLGQEKEVLRNSEYLISEKHDENKVKTLFSGNYLTVSNPETSLDLAVFGASIQILYSVTTKFGIGGGAGTYMSTAGAGAATVLNWAFTYALTGKISSLSSSYELDGREIMVSRDGRAEGLRAQVMFSQYYFNGSQNTIPFGGLGGVVYYDKYVKQIGYNLMAGVRMDYLFNNDNNLAPISLMVGAVY